MKFYTLLALLFVHFCLSASAFNSLTNVRSPHNVTVEDREEFRMLDVLARLIAKSIQFTQLSSAELEKDIGPKMGKIIPNFTVKAARKHEYARDQIKYVPGAVATAFIRNEANDGWNLAVATASPVPAAIINAAAHVWAHSYAKGLYVGLFKSNDNELLKGADQKQKDVQGIYQKILDGESRLGNKKDKNLYSDVQNDVDLRYLAFLYTQRQTNEFAAQIFDILENNQIVVLPNPRNLHAELVIAEHLLSRKKADALGDGKNNEGKMVSYSYIGGNIKNCKKCAVAIRGIAKTPVEMPLLNLLYVKDDNAMVFFTQGNFYYGYPGYVLPNWMTSCLSAAEFLNKNAKEPKENHAKDLLIQMVGPHSFCGKDNFQFPSVSEEREFHAEQGAIIETSQNTEDVKESKEELPVANDQVCPPATISWATRASAANKSAPITSVSIKVETNGMAQTQSTSACTGERKQGTVSRKTNSTQQVMQKQRANPKRKDTKK